MATRGVLKRPKKPTWMLMSEQAQARLGMTSSGKDRSSFRDSEHSESCRPSIRSSHTKSENSVSARGPLQSSFSTRMKVHVDDEDKAGAAVAAAAAAVAKAAAFAADVAETSSSKDDERVGSMGSMKEDSLLLPVEQPPRRGSQLEPMGTTAASLLQPLEPMGAGLLQPLPLLRTAGNSEDKKAETGVESL
jgi:hypothetical protein